MSLSSGRRFPACVSSDFVVMASRLSSGCITSPTDTIRRRTTSSCVISRQTLATPWMPSYCVGHLNPALVYHFDRFTILIASGYDAMPPHDKFVHVLLILLSNPSDLSS